MVIYFSPDFLLKKKKKFSCWITLVFTKWAKGKVQGVQGSITTTGSLFPWKDTRTFFLLTWSVRPIISRVTCPLLELSQTLPFLPQYHFTYYWSEYTSSRISSSSSLKSIIIETLQLKNDGSWNFNNYNWNIDKLVCDSHYFGVGSEWNQRNRMS